MSTTPQNAAAQPGGSTSTGTATNANKTEPLKTDLPKPPDSQPAMSGTAASTTVNQKRVSLTGNGFEPVSILAYTDESILFTNDGDTERTIAFNKGLPDLVLKPKEQKDVKLIHTGEFRALAGGKELIVQVEANRPGRRRS